MLLGRGPWAIPYTGRMEAEARARVRLRAPALVVGASEATWLDRDGVIEDVSLAEAARRAQNEAPLVCYAPLPTRRLGIGRFPAYDVLELFAFARPARFCVPTPAGLAAALGLAPPADRGAEAATLIAAVRALLAGLAENGAGAGPIAAAMGRGGWPWSEAVLAALGETEARAGGLDAWNRLPGWSEAAPRGAPGDDPVSPAEARDRLAELLGDGAELRLPQGDYAEAAAAAFAPRAGAGAPNIVLAEGGTGVGKTLGYVAPASVWAAKNGGAVWLSTFTRNLQRQIDQELDRLYPDPRLKSKKVVVRKGRDNYLCLLNLEEAVTRGAAGEGLVALGLIARWAAATRDGDLLGGDFPTWLAGLFGYGRTLGLAHRRGECLYSACPHYGKCYIERAIRKARGADIVIANHALVMAQAGTAEAGAGLPTRYVFDEGHHLFDAADGAYGAHLSGTEAAELRRWLRGGEGRRRGRVRGLERRIGDLVAHDEAAQKALDDALRRAAALPGEGWLGRVAEGTPRGAAETFLRRVWEQVEARAAAPNSEYGLEATVEPRNPELGEAAHALASALADLATPLRTLTTFLSTRLDEEASDLDTATRIRIEAACRSLAHRLNDRIGAWRDMLAGLAAPEPEPGAGHPFIDWLAIHRIEGRNTGVGMHRHWIDPTIPFAATVLSPAHGVVITSATLRDRAAGEDDWTAAEVRTGALHLALPAKRASVPSPFDYTQNTRLFVITDVRRDDPAQVAAACRELFGAAGGGALGLFTAIARLREVHRRIAEPLEAAGIPLLGQHVDPIDTSTLVDIFRAEPTTCLLGTDALRDGIDVPGPSLRLIVFDRVPWPRPNILHRARRAAFGRDYDDVLARLKLKQAFGRLLRRAEDRGVFVLLDRRLPSRLATAFPEGVAVARVGLAEAVAEMRRFLDAGGA